jgi:diacylglycerol kinase family enzyme
VSAGRTGVVIVNPHAGSERDTPEAIGAALAGLEVRSCEPNGLRAELERAVADKAEVVAVAGGDGTMRSAAGVLAGTDSTMLPVPLGTFNHFARGIGIDTVEVAGEALERGTPTRIDLGEVDGEVFLNNASIGWYAEMLQTRARLEKRISRQLAKVVGLLAYLPKAPRFDVEVDGELYRTWLVWVGNGRYDMRVGHLSERVSVTEHRLDVRILAADRRLARFRAAWALMTGSMETSEALMRFTPTEATFRLAVPVGVDGDGVTLPAPLHFRSLPEALSVLPAPGWKDEPDADQ